MLNELALAPAKATASASATAIATPDVLGARGHPAPIGDRLVAKTTGHCASRYFFGVLNGILASP